MGARIIQLAEIRAKRSELALKAAELEGTVELTETADLAERFHFWSGASGRRYVHTVYCLIECPALPAGNYVLVRRDECGRRTALAIGRVMNEAPSLNLAKIRQHGAALGANEVHVHLLASTPTQSKLVEFDLRTGHAKAVGAEPHSHTHH
ncbi:MAG TPA: hypothetical protein VJ045_03435 [Hyphomicrobiaceae bacterium]|nr:hypothetical protein [Hyphomicrobiaceae bacterium]